jgi:hypothetical protein
VLLVALAACGDNRVPPDAPAPRDLVTLPAHANRELDLLFVLTNEPGDALDLQFDLRRALPSLFTTISLDGPPDLHLGTITPDLGSSTKYGIGPSIGSHGAAGCSGRGDDGALFMGRFATDLDDFLFAPGANGCAYQQPLAAMAAAFANPVNAGFRRREAALGVIVLADEDDCSALDPSLFDPSATALGPLSLFRCARFGLACAEPDMTTPGPRTNCVPKADSTIIEDPADFVDVLRGQVDDPRRLVFGAIVAPSDVEIELRAPPGSMTLMPATKHTCNWTADGDVIHDGDEALRLSWFANQFGDRGVVGSVCNADLSPATTMISNTLRHALGDPCVEDDVPLTSCTAVDQLGTTETPLEHCEAPTETDCWELVTDPDVCPNAAHQKLIVRHPHDLLDGTYTVLRC